MNFYEREMKLMFADNDIIKDAKFLGKTVLGKIDDNLRVKLQIVSTKVSGKYDTIQSSIINRTQGIIDKQYFKFADIIGKQKRPGLSDIDPHMWDYDDKSEWYIPISPTQKAMIADTVLDYISMFQTPNEEETQSDSITMTI